MLSRRQNKDQKHDCVVSIAHGRRGVKRWCARATIIMGESMIRVEIATGMAQFDTLQTF